MISFAAIVQGRDSSVRVTSDGMISVIDLVMVVTGKNCNHANECIRNMKQSLFNTENIILRDQTRLISLEHAIQLVMVLPGKGAKESRALFAEIIKRYMIDNAFIKCTTSPAVGQPVSPRDIGIKRGFDDIDADEQGVDFVCKSFDLQEEALEFRHGRDMAAFKNKNRDLVQMHMEIELFEKENGEDEQCIESLKLQINSVREDLPSVTEEWDYLYNAIRILGEPHIQELEAK